MAELQIAYQGKMVVLAEAESIVKKGYLLKVVVQAMEESLAGVVGVHETTL